MYLGVRYPLENVAPGQATALANLGPPELVAVGDNSGMLMDGAQPSEVHAQAQATGFNPGDRSNSTLIKP